MDRQPLDNPQRRDPALCYEGYKEVINLIQINLLETLAVRADFAWIRLGGNATFFSTFFWFSLSFSSIVIVCLKLCLSLVVLDNVLITAEPGFGPLSGGRVTLREELDWKLSFDKVLARSLC